MDYNKQNQINSKISVKHNISLRVQNPYMNQLKIKTISINEEINNSHNKFKLSYNNRSQINEQF